MELTQQSNKSLAPTEAGELIREDNAHPAIKGMVSLSMVRQIGVLLALAVSIAVGVAVALWSQTPDYSLLYASVGDKEIGEVIDALDKLGVDYKIESSSGAIMVPQDAVHRARMKLASQGLPNSNSVGFELLDTESGFGTSQKMESARYQRALEGEIARSIAVFQNVKSARVHLALPKQSVFIRERKKASASVIVNLYSGRYLEKGQIEAIVHMVASSVPELESGQVTVVDQRGNLLNAKHADDHISMSNKQFEYKKEIENHLIHRVENILTPLVGADSIRTQLSADIDFTTTERTQERYNPDLPALRSEQSQEQQSRLSGAQGIPGALTNQPPAAGVAPEVAGNEGGNAPASPVNSSRNSTRNYELDKTISHSRLATGQVRRMSVAVVVDNRRIVQEDGTVLEQPYSEEDLTRFTDLVKQAIGFDIVRGDQVIVRNAAFRLPDPQEPLPDLPIWEQGWFQTLTKQAVALSVALVLILGVIRPTLRSLVARDQPESKQEDEEQGEKGEAEGVKALPPGSEEGPSDEQGALTKSENADQLLLEAPKDYENRLQFAQKLVDDDVKRVAQVIKNWVKEDA